MSIPKIRRANQEDAALLHSLLKKSKGCKLNLSIGVLRQDLSSLHDVDLNLETMKNHDASFEFDINLVKPNCPACQAYLASVNGVYVGHLIFHYFYTPWRGRMVFLDDMFVDDTFKEKGVMNKLLDRLTDFCKRQNLPLILFNSTDVSRELMETIGDFECKILRDDNTDWSVFRVDFCKSKDDHIPASSSGQSTKGC